MSSTATDLGPIGNNVMRSLQIDIDVAHQVIYWQTVHSNHEQGSPQFNAQMDDYVAHYEDQFKKLPEWLEQDVARNGSWLFLRTSQGQMQLRCTWSLRARTRVYLCAVPPADPGTPEFEEWLPEQAAIAESNWFKDRPQYVPL
jgi:hypothetical protein